MKNGYHEVRTKLRKPDVVSGRVGKVTVTQLSDVEVAERSADRRVKVLVQTLRASGRVPTDAMIAKFRSAYIAKFAEELGIELEITND